MKSLVQDIRYGWRTMLTSPWFAVVAVVTLAMAIGANAVVFSVLNAMILRPLNLPREESLYMIQHGSDKDPSHSYPNYLDLRDRNRSFDDLAAFAVNLVALDMGKNTSRALAFEVSGNYFDALGIQPYLGHFFSASDEHGPNSAPYIVLSYAFWHAHLQDDRGVVGRTVQVNKHPFTILGVAPPGFHGTLLIVHPDLFVPVVHQEQIEGTNLLNARGTRSLSTLVGHLRAGVAPAQAVADLNSVGSDLEKAYPKDDNKMTFTLARPGLYGDQLGGPIQAFLAGLMLLAGLILLAACANLGSLFAARAADRSREVALRLALGASRMRIVQQLFTEAVLISLVGGALGVWCSVLLLRALSTWQPFAPFPVYLAMNPDAKVYGMALLLTLASGFLFGAVPVRQVFRTDPYEIVKSGSSARVGRRLSFREALLAVQIAICAVLITSSMVALRGLMRSLHGNFGFEPRNAMLVDTDLTYNGYSSDKFPAIQKRLLDALKAIPGVEAVGLGDGVPIGEGGGLSLVFTDKTTDLRSANAAAEATMYKVSPEYFQAAGTTVLSGRTFTWHDDKGAPRVAVVNREFARKVFGSQSSAVGGSYKLPDGTRVQVVGLVEDGKYNTFTEEQRSAMFLPILQSPSGSTTWMEVRSSRDHEQLAAAIRSKLRELDQALDFEVLEWNDDLEGVRFPARVATSTLGVMGGIGAILAITGIFGMAAYSVSKRLRELGIRIALGAQRKGVLQAALGRAFKLLAFGSAAGLILGILASRLLAHIVYQATPRDPLVLAGVVVAMALLGLLATWIPAQRALSVDPLILLREE